MKTRLGTQNTSPFGFFLCLLYSVEKGKGGIIIKNPKVMGDVKVDDDAILKSFLAEVGEVERDNEVVRFPSQKHFL